MRRRSLGRVRLAVGAAAAALVVPAALYLSTGSASAAGSNVLTNAGFESGSLSSWSCDAGTAGVVTSPVHSGSYALGATPTSSDDAQCTQTVSVQASTTYTLSAYVEGSYVYLGANGGNDTWTPSATSWQQLSTTVTTTASQTSLTIYLHGWYAQPEYYADDVSLTSGTGGSSPTSTSTSTGSSSPTGTASPTPTGTGTVGSGSVGKVAPYVDMSNNQETMLNSAAKAGLKTYTAAFVISAGCAPIWGDTLPVTNDPAMDEEIATAKADGATPIVSFGGAGGTELAMACTTESSLQAAYQSVITHLGVTYIDFDIEGAPLDYTADNNLLFEAIAEIGRASCRERVWCLV